MGGGGGTSVNQHWVFAGFPVLAFWVPAPSGVASLLTFSTPAHAEPMRLAQAVEYGGLPPYEIVTIVRSAGVPPPRPPGPGGPQALLPPSGPGRREGRGILRAARRGNVPLLPLTRAPP